MNLTRITCHLVRGAVSCALLFWTFRAKMFYYYSYLKKPFCTLLFFFFDETFLSQGTATVTAGLERCDLLTYVSFYPMVLCIVWCTYMNKNSRYAWTLVIVFEHPAHSATAERAHLLMTLPPTVTGIFTHIWWVSGLSNVISSPDDDHNLQNSF